MAFNKLTDAESERLALLIEECGEVIQAATKVLRHGWASRYDNSETNQEALEREIGDVQAVLFLMAERIDYRRGAAALAEASKLEKLKAGMYLHHNP
jgi:NTP pyrophosphatase (non-canonical NTP hydrolase)